MSGRLVQEFKYLYCRSYILNSRLQRVEETGVSGELSEVTGNFIPCREQDSTPGNYSFICVLFLFSKYSIITTGLLT